MVEGIRKKFYIYDKDKKRIKENENLTEEKV